MDSQQKNKNFKDKQEFPFDLLCDTDRAMSLAYGAVEAADAKSAARISYVIGPDRKVQKVYAKVKAAQHPAEVLGELR